MFANGWLSRKCIVAVWPVKQWFLTRIIYFRFKVSVYKILCVYLSLTMIPYPYYLTYNPNHLIYNPNLDVVGINGSGNNCCMVSLFLWGVVLSGYESLFVCTFVINLSAFRESAFR